MNARISSLVIADLRPWACQELRFALKTGLARRVACEQVRQDLCATSRPSFASRAVYTSPMPPAPSGDATSYGPSRLPDARDMCGSRADYTAAGGRFVDGGSPNGGARPHCEAEHEWGQTLVPSNRR